VDPIGNKTFEGSLESPWAGHGYTAGQEYVMFMGLQGFACCASSLSIPEFAADALGFEMDRQCLCIKCDAYGGLMPDKEHDNKDSEHLQLSYVMQTSCIKPKTCCKDTMRIGFFHMRSSFPCDETVPFGCACFGIKLCTLAGGEQAAFKSCHYGCKTKE
jgi:hypothetical protein